MTQQTQGERYGHGIHHPHGNIEEDEGNENLEGLVHGPFYSWIDGTNVKIVNAARLVIKVVNMHGPFDGQMVSVQVSSSCLLLDIFLSFPFCRPTLTHYPYPYRRTHVVDAS